jgi:hypothetical protein
MRALGRLAALAAILAASQALALPPQVTPPASGGGSTSPGGSSGQIQYNNGGSFAGGNLSGDCTTSTLAITCTKTNGSAFGTAATANTGTSGANVPLLNGGNTWSGASLFSAAGAASTPGVKVTGAPYTAGSASTNYPQTYLDFGASEPTTFSTAGTAFGVNASSGWTGDFADFFVNGGARVFGVGYTGSVFGNGDFTSGGQMVAASASNIRWNGRGILSSPAVNQVQIGTTDAASPSAQTLKVQNVVAGTSNTAGVNLNLQGSQGTGTGAGGSLIFQTAPAGTTGTAQNAEVTVLTLDATGTTGTATFAGPVVLNSTLNGNTFSSGTSTFTGGGTYTYTFPAATGTVAELGLAQTWSATQTFGTMQPSVGGKLQLNSIVAFAVPSSAPTCSATGGSPTCTMTAYAGTAALWMTLGSAGSATTISVSGLTTTSHAYVCPVLLDTTTTTIWGLQTSWSTTGATWTFYTKGTTTAASPGASDVVTVSCTGV